MKKSKLTKKALHAKPAPKKTPKEIVAKAEKVSKKPAAKKARKRKGFSYKKYKKRVIAQTSGMKAHLELAGIEQTPLSVGKKLFTVSIFLTLAVSAFALYLLSTTFRISLTYSLFVMFMVWTVLFLFILFLVWLVFLVYLDLRIHKRTKSVEEVLPEFLQLTAANIRAGMSIDRAMWFAMRPKFGIFAKEIENVAKSTYAGEDFNTALLSFSRKYKSPLVSRSINLLIEGIEAGGEIAGLLNRISEDITNVKLLKKDMAASVTTYIIFISVATLIAAPLLFALSTQLLGVVTNLSGQLGTNSGSTVSSVGFSFSQVAVEESDFRIFSMVAIAVTSFFAACIVATVKTGSIKSGFRYIPVFLSTSVFFYIILNALLAGVFKNILLF